MTNYSVNKYFGHFWQCWHLTAESDEDAWNRAEKDGKLKYQQAYKELKDKESKGYVVNLDKQKEDNPPISSEQYYEWMREAEKIGMVITPKEYEQIYRLPFHAIS